MAPTFESAGAIAQSSGLAPAATLVVAITSGVVADSIVLLPIYTDPATSTITAPAGFTEAADSPVALTGSPQQRISLYWKRATGSESGTYTIGFSPNTYAESATLRFSGCITSGSPFDPDAGATDSAGNQSGATVSPAVSITTTVADTLLVHVAGNWSGGTWTPSTGFTTRVTGGFDLLHVATKAQAAVGGSGTVQATNTSNATTSAWLGALRGPAASNWTYGFDVRIGTA